MGLFDFIRSRFFEKRADVVDLGSVKISETLLTALLDPDYMTIDRAMSIPAFAGCVNRICETASMVPIRLYRRNGDKVTEVDDERTRLLNVDTKDTLSAADFKKRMMYDYLTGTGAYAYVNKIGTKWKSINYVDPSKISFMESLDPIFKDYQIYVEKKAYYPHKFIKFIRNTKNGYKGRSITEEHRLLLTVVYNSLLFENSNVKKGGTKKGFLQSENKLDQDAIDKLKAAYAQMYANNDNAERVVVLNKGITFQEAGMSSLEMQLNQSKQQNDIEICKIFGMPPTILSGSATAQDAIFYVQHCVLPKLETLCKALDRDMLLESEKGEYFYAPDVSELTKADIKTRFEAWGIAVKNGYMQLDEVREKENLPALNFPFIKLGLQDVLYDPKTGAVYTPNTGMTGSISDYQKNPPKQGDDSGGKEDTGTDEDNTES